MVTLKNNNSDALRNLLSAKCKDQSSFTIPYSIGGKNVGRALCGIGANINLMPLSVFKALDTGEVHPTPVTLQLVDRSKKKIGGKNRGRVSKI